MQRQLNGGDIVSWANEVGTTEYSWEIIETWPKYHILYKNLGTVSKWTISSFQFSCSVMSVSLQPWTAAHQFSLSITNSPSLLKLMSIKLMMPSNHLILCHPFLLLPSVFPSIRVFFNESVLCIRWKSTVTSASSSVLPTNIQGSFLLGLSVLMSLMSKGLSRVFSNTTVQKHQFFSTQLSLWSNSHINTWLVEKP